MDKSDKFKKEKMELNAQTAVMRDALIQALYTLEWLEQNPGDWDDQADRALKAVTSVLYSDAGHEFLDSYVKMQKALITQKATQLLGEMVMDDNKDLH